jgi:hypothetical protein
MTTSHVKAILLKALSQNAVLSVIFQTMENAEHNINTVNQRLSQTFRESRATFNKQYKMYLTVMPTSLSCGVS